MNTDYTNDQLKVLDPNAKVSDDYFAFFGGKSPFSNFYLTNFKYNKHTFCCSEQAFMYAKAYIMHDFEMAEKIADYELKDKEIPIVYKRMGRKVKNYNDDLWSKYRQRVMTSILYNKFNNADLLFLLKATGNRKIIEASPYDGIWGAHVGLGSIDEHWDDFYGDNLLGKILMELRNINIKAWPSF